MLQIKIRQEQPEDFKNVFTLIQNAFEDEVVSDHKEQFLVERLRHSENFIPELSLVAEFYNQIVGYILVTKIKIKNVQSEHISLALAPVAVLKKFQGKGIGSQLIKKAHAIAKKMGFGSIILLGHKDYYPQFGYKTANTFGIELPFDVPEENCMAIELYNNSLKDISGIVHYPKEFFE